MNRARISMNQLAKRAGVHVSTVSRALRGQVSIPEKTRRRIQELATKLGYRPDPVLDALCAYRKGIAEKSHRPTLAIIATSSAWRENLANRLYFEGARDRADEQGYQTEIFVMTPTRLSCRRLAGILAARGIRGVIVLPLADVSIPLDFPWEKFLVVATGYKLKAPSISRVSINHFAAMGQALQHVHTLGYKRPGLVLRDEGAQLAPDGATYVSKIWEGGYLAETPKHFPDLLIPAVRAASQAALERWLTQHQPDVLISQHRGVTTLLPPTAVGFPIVYTMVDDDENLTGIHQNSRHVGRHAVDLLVGCLYRQDPGSQAVPVTVLVETRWQAGTSAPRRQPA